MYMQEADEIFWEVTVENLGKCNKLNVDSDID